MKKLLLLLLFPALLQAQQRNIELGFSLPGSSCLKTSQGVIESARKLGINNIMILDVFGRSYGSNMALFAYQCKKIIFNPNGITHLNLCVSSASYAEMTAAKKKLIPKEGGKAGDFVNRFAPVDTTAYKALLNSLISELNKLKLMPYISWSLWQEPNARKYFWGTIPEFKVTTRIKYNVLKPTGRPIYFPHASISLLLNPDFLNHRDWYDCVNDLLKEYPDMIPSHSFYHHASAGDWNWNKNEYPFAGQHTICPEYNLSADGADEAKINSPQWTVKFVEFLQNIVKYDWKVDKVFFFCLLDCVADGNNGAMAAMLHIPNDPNTPLDESHFEQKDLWKEIVKVCSVLWNGKGFSYEPTPGGVKGVSKSITIDNQGKYIITNN